MWATTDVEMTALRDLSVRIGRDPMLTQASTGNTSIKRDGVLWIKASGKWLEDANDDEIFIPVDLREVQECVQRNMDPIENYAKASVETAMHAVLPHRVVMHVHSINTIAWAVRQDAPARLKRKLDGLRWAWIPYVPSGLPLAFEIDRAFSYSAGLDILVLGNHGLVIGAEDGDAAERLLKEVERRLTICARCGPEAGYARLTQIANDSGMSLPRDAELHALGTDPIARRILSGGHLYPCQAIFSGGSFQIIEGAGMLIDQSMKPAEYAMLCGLARVIQRIDASAPIRYLTSEELGNGINLSAYRQLANARRIPA